MATGRAAKRKRPVDEDVIVTEPALRYKDDHLDALDVDADKDFISPLPTEILHNIFSFLVLDHDPDRGIKVDAEPAKGYRYKEQPHALLSLSTMSRHLCANIESFSCHHLTMHQKTYKYFKSTATSDKERRRSSRLAEKPRDESRLYRGELVKHLHRYCWHCGRWCNRRATMANGVVCCLGSCENEAFPPVMVSVCRGSSTCGTLLMKHQNLSEALSSYDLRDYMLIKTRAPGPRAKRIEFPTIPYATVRKGLGWGLGMTVSYKFYSKDVEMIARLVHGDVTAHMRTKREKKAARELKKLRELHIELKIRYHTDRLASATKQNNKHLKKLHQERTWSVCRSSDRADRCSRASRVPGSGVGW